MTNMGASLRNFDDLLGSDSDDDDDPAPSSGAPLALGSVAGVGLGLGYARPGGRATMAAAADPDPEDMQRLLELAERVALACDARAADYGVARVECANLCGGNMCCVAGGTCAGERSDCAAYAGCEVLLVAPDGGLA